MRRLHPGWGPRTILNRLIREGAEPLPDRSSICRALVRHQLIFPSLRKRKPSDYKRWERSRPMELWQMDVTAGVYLADGTRPLVVTGIDDHSRFCVCANVVARATAKPVCDALLGAMETHGVPEAILTDNGKVFTGRFGKGPGLVLFDRICRENGIRHLLTAPRSPTTTGKVERFHKTMKSEFWAARSSIPSRWRKNSSAAAYGVGNAYRRRQVEVAVVKDTVQIWSDGKPPPHPPHPPRPPKGARCLRQSQW